MPNAFDETFDSIDRATGRHFASRPGVGLVVAVVKGAEARTGVYGSPRAVDTSQPFDELLFEIGSITKLLIASLLGLHVIDGVVALDQPVAHLFPEAPGLPRSITYKSLATHTSGLPRLPDNIYKSARSVPHDPYSKYGENDLIEYLRNIPVDDVARRSGTIAYSNLGYALLGHALVRETGTGSEGALLSQLRRHFELRDTSWGHDATTTNRLATPHRKTGRIASPWHLGPFWAAGGLVSSLRDVTEFLASHCDGVGRLPSAMALTRRMQSDALPPRRVSRLFSHAFRPFRIGRSLPTARVIGVGLGWHIARLLPTGTVSWLHSGATGGFSSFVGLRNEPRSGIVILSNEAGLNARVTWTGINLTRLGIQLLEGIR